MENRANLVFLRLVLTEVCLITIYKLQYFFGENLLFFLNTWKSIFRDQEKRIKNTYWEIKLLSQLEGRMLP